MFNLSICLQLRKAFFFLNVVCDAENICFEPQRNNGNEPSHTDPNRVVPLKNTLNQLAFSVIGTCGQKGGVLCDLRAGLLKEIFEKNPVKKILSSFPHAKTKTKPNDPWL